MRMMVGRKAVSWLGCCADMEISVAEQAVTFVEAFMLGGGAGVLYDLMRLVRKHIKISALGHVLDFLFWAVVTAALLAFSATATGGVVQIYVLIAAFGGAIVYFIGLSAWIRALGDIVVCEIRRLIQLALSPIRLLLKILKKIQKNFKNVFLYRRKWFKIIATFKGMEDAAQFGAARREEGECHAYNKSQPVDQNLDPGAADRCGYLFAGAQQPHGSGTKAERQPDSSGSSSDANQCGSGRCYRAQRRSRSNGRRGP